MTNRVSDWGMYSELLDGLASQSLDWSSWSSLTQGVVNNNPGLWGAVEENALHGKGLAELIGEIYGASPTDVDLDSPSEFHATDEHVLSMLWHVLHAQPATDMAGYEGWDGYFMCWEPDGSLTYADARDAEEWTPVYAAEEEDQAEQGGDAADDIAPEPVFTAWGDYWIKDENGQRWFGATKPDGPWYTTAEEFAATLQQATPQQAATDDITKTMDELIAANPDFAGISEERRAVIADMARELVRLGSSGSGD